MACVSEAFNREQKDGTLAFRVWRKKLNYVIVEEGQTSRTEMLGIRGQIHSAADGACLQLDGPVAGVPVLPELWQKLSIFSLLNSMAGLSSGPIRGIYFPSFVLAPVK